MLRQPPEGSAATSTPAPAIATTPTLAADTSDWADRAATWEKDFNADNLKGVVALYAGDGCRMPPHASTAQGSEGILASLKLAKDQGVASIKITVASAESSGNLSYAKGSFEVSSAEGKPLDHGKWMGVSKKLNGKWLTQCDIWNSDLPIPSNKAQ